jgi:hypothetical protein
MSGKAKRSQNSAIEKERKRCLIEAKETVNLVATSVLDLFVPLILDLSTSLLTPSSSTENACRSPFEELLITLLYFTNLTDVEPIALSKASEVTVHLFKTLAKDLTPSSPSVEDESEENSQRIRRIWNFVRNALGAPLPDYQNLTKVPDVSPDGEASDSNSEGDASEADDELSKEPSKSLEEPKKPLMEQVEDPDFELAEFVEDQNDETKSPETCPTKTDSTSQPSNDVKLQQLLQQVLKSTTPSSRRLVATSFAYLLRKKGISELLIKLMLNDLNQVEVDEVATHGALQPRKHKVQVARKGTSVRSLLGEEQGGARLFAEGICWALCETCKVSLHEHLSTLKELC